MADLAHVPMKLGRSGAVVSVDTLVTDVTVSAINRSNAFTKYCSVIDNLLSLDVCIVICISLLFALSIYLTY